MADELSGTTRLREALLAADRPPPAPSNTIDILMGAIFVLGYGVVAALLLTAVCRWALETVF